MLNLSQLRFEVDSSELEKAVGTIREIGTAMDSLAKSSGKVTTSAEDTAKVIQKTSKVVKDSNEDIADSGDKVTAALEKATNALRFQADGYSKGQSGQLAYLKSLGATTEQLKEYGDVLQKQRVLQGANPFDASLSSMVAIRNEYRLLVDAQRQYGSGAELTMQQMKDLTIEKMRLITTAQMEGTSFKELRNSIRQLEAQYETAAGKVNNLRAAQAAQDKAAKDTANANAYIAKEMERVTFATSAMNSELNRSTTNALLRFEKQLKLSGLSVDEQTAKLNAYKAALLQMDAASKKTNTDYISRALGPQITDIFVGLSTGQSPLTVMLQQGGQLRDQLTGAGVAADQMGAAMRTAAADMVVSVKAVALAFGQLIGGAFIDAGKSLGSSLANVLGMTAAIAKMNEAVAASAATGNMWALSLQVIGHALPMVFGAALAASTVALVGFGIGLKQVIEEEDSLAKQLALTGGALNISSTEAIAYARALDQGNVSTGRAIEVITEMAKAGNLGRDSIALITKSAVDMQMYAGISIEDTVKSFSKMKEKPVEALIELAKQTGMVSEETVRSVIELQNQGREADAASKAIAALGAVNTKRVEQMKQDYSDFSLFMKELGRGISNFFADVFKDLWYKADPGKQMEQQFGKLNDRIREVESNLGKLGGFGDTTLLDQLKKERDLLLEQIDAYDRKNARRRDEKALNVKAANILQAEYELDKKYEDELLKAGKKKLTQEEYITKKTQEQLEDQAKKLGMNVTELIQNEKLLKLAQDRAKLM